MQPYPPSNVQSVPAMSMPITEETKYKDASTNTNSASINIYVTDLNEVFERQQLSILRNDLNGPLVCHSCSDVQHYSLDKNICRFKRKSNATNTKQSLSGYDNTLRPDICAQPPFIDEGGCCYHSMLPGSHVRHSIKSRDKELLENTSHRNHSSSFNQRDFSSISSLPRQTSFQNGRQFQDSSVILPRKRLDNRLSSSEGSLDSSLSKADHRYGAPTSRVFDLLDLQTVFYDPIVNQHTRNRYLETDKNHLPRYI